MAESEKMFAVQTLAKRVASDAEAVGESGCLAACYGYIADKQDDAMRFLFRLCLARREGIIDKERTVYDATRFLNWWTRGKRKYKVTKVPIKNGDISHIKKATPVQYLAKGHGGHWVVVKDGKIEWNPLEHSYNVEHGVPVDSRVVEEV